MRNTPEDHTAADRIRDSRADSGQAVLDNAEDKHNIGKNVDQIGKQRSADRLQIDRKQNG